MIMMMKGTKIRSVAIKDYCYESPPIPRSYRSRERKTVLSLLVCWPASIEFTNSYLAGDNSGEVPFFPLRIIRSVGVPPPAGVVRRGRGERGKHHCLIKGFSVLLSPRCIPCRLASLPRKNGRGGGGIQLSGRVRAFPVSAAREKEGKKSAPGKFECEGGCT